MLLFHQGFLLFLADACSNGGVKQLLGRIRDLGELGGYAESLFTQAKKKNRCHSAVGEVCESMKGFKKPL